MPTSSPERSEFWDAKLTYVIGHQRPDTDAIAAAIGYAWVLGELGHENLLAVRAGQPGPQAQYALQRFEQAAPRLLSAVAPTFWHIAEPRLSALPDAPLQQAMGLLVDGGEPMIPVVGVDKKPLGVITSLALARAYGRTLSSHGSNGSQSSSGANKSKASAPTCSDVCEVVPTFESHERISDHRNALLRSDENEFLVVDEAGLYMGMATQRQILQPPRARLILVDHNELSQAVAGASEADIVGVLDHHRLGNPPTVSPIPFVVEPVGSTSTLVAERCRTLRKNPPRGVAGMLLSGILSDTLTFRSPTTGERDKAMAHWLGSVCSIDPHLYGEELLGVATGLGSRSIEDILDSDRKAYTMGTVPVSIGQVEVTGMQELPQRRADILQAMDARRDREHLDLIALMVTDVVTGRSRLLCRGESKLMSALPFPRLQDGEYELGDIVSRKKQLAPALQNAIETAF